MPCFLFSNVIWFVISLFISDYIFSFVFRRGVCCNHFSYIYFNKLHYPSKFKELEHTFITKWSTFGETWKYSEQNSFYTNESPNCMEENIEKPSVWSQNWNLILSPLQGQNCSQIYVVGLNLRIWHIRENIMM